MNTYKERKLTLLETISAVIMVVGVLVVIGSLIWRLITAFTN